MQLSRNLESFSSIWKVPGIVDKRMFSAKTFRTRKNFPGSNAPALTMYFCLLGGSAINGSTLSRFLGCYTKRVLKSIRDTFTSPRGKTTIYHYILAFNFNIVLLQLNGVIPILCNKYLLPLVLKTAYTILLIP